VQRANGDIDFVLDRDAWEIHVLVESAIEEVIGVRPARAR
jgi:hypothetical protein